jgi:integrase
VQNLTDLSVRSLPPGYHWDGKTKGFGIRVGKNRKSWVVIYGRNRTKVTLGHYPALSLADARKKALLTLGSPLVAKGVVTFPEAIDGFLTQTHWRASTRYSVEKSLRKHFRWNKRLDQITHQDILAVVDQLPRGAQGEAVKHIRSFFNWCVPRYLEHSPAARIKSPGYASRDRVLTHDELRRVWIAAEQMGGYFATIVKLLVVTGQRRGEIASLRADMVAEGKITLPAWLTKNNREHSFPLGSWASQLLLQLSTHPIEKPSSLLFPARNSQNIRPFNGWSKSKAALDKLSGVTDWTLHDLRRTFATGLAALGTPIHVTEKILNHVSGTTGGLTGIYQRHQWWDEQVAAIAAWEAKIRSLLPGAS